MTRNRAYQVASLVVAVAILVSTPVLAAEWWFRAGPVFRGNMDLRVGGSSYVQSLQIHAAEPFEKDPWQGGRAGYDERSYEDGFVREDTATEFDGLTWNWGYEDSGQYDAGSDTLAFHLGGGVRVMRETLLDEPFRREDELEGLGLDVMAGKQVITWEGSNTFDLACDLCLGLQGVWNMRSQMRGTSYRERITKERYVVRDVYDLDGVVPPVAPYEGDFLGPGPLIPNIPSEHERIVTHRTSWEAENDVEFDTRTGMLAFWAGPRLSIVLPEKMRIYVLPNVSATYVDIDVERDEQFVAIYEDGSSEVLESWHDERSEGECLLGGGVRAGAEVSIAHGWYIGAYGGHDWYTDEAEVMIGPNVIHFDPTGYSAGAQIGKRL